MPRDDHTTAKHRNRRIRQDALREQLSQQKHHEHVVEILNEVRDPSQEIDANMLARYKLVIDTKLKLMNKYIGDVKSVELTGEDGDPIKMQASFVITPVKPKDD
jgi:phage gp36-like protein